MTHIIDCHMAVCACMFEVLSTALADGGLVVLLDLNSIQYY